MSQDKSWPREANVPISGTGGSVPVWSAELSLIILTEAELHPVGQ